MRNNFKEKIHQYELIQYEGYSPQRQYKIYNLTESEAHERNQSYALQQIAKRLVKVKARFN